MRAGRRPALWRSKHATDHFPCRSVGDGRFLRPVTEGVERVPVGARHRSPDQLPAAASKPSGQPIVHFYWPTLRQDTTRTETGFKGQKRWRAASKRWSAKTAAARRSTGQSATMTAPSSRFETSLTTTTERPENEGENRAAPPTSNRFLYAGLSKVNHPHSSLTTHTPSFGVSR